MRHKKEAPTGAGTGSKSFTGTEGRETQGESWGGHQGGPSPFLSWPRSVYVAAWKQGYVNVPLLPWGHVAGNVGQHACPYTHPGKPTALCPV